MYLSEIGNYPPPDQRREGGSGESRALGKYDRQIDVDQLVEANLAFVVKIAHEYRNMGIAFEDLLGEGNIGLIEAARRYDPARGTRFITYAVWWIRKSILKALASQAGLFRLPEYRIRKVKQVQEAKATLSRRLGREPKRGEISECLKRSVAEIDEILLTRPRAVSLNQNTGPEGSPIGDLLADPSSLSPEDRLLRGEARQLVQDALRTLTRKERMIIRRRMGMLDRRPMTLKEIGNAIGVSRERVRQIEHQAMIKLRRYFVKRSLPPRIPTSFRLIQPSGLSGQRERRQPKRRARRATRNLVATARAPVARPLPRGLNPAPAPPLDH